MFSSAIGSTLNPVEVILVDHENWGVVATESVAKGLFWYHVNVTKTL